MSGINDSRELTFAATIPKTAGDGCAAAIRCGRRGMPKEWVARMYADYLRLGSLSKVGRLNGRTRQSVYCVFKAHLLKLNSRNFKRQITYGGRQYTLDKDDYWRDTIFRSKSFSGEVFLHRRMWTDKRGPIPAGNTICFKDGDRSNCVIGNLVMLTHAEQQQVRGTGRNQFSTTAKARLDLLVGNFQSGRRTLSARLKEAA